MSRAIGSHISAMKRHAASQIMVLTKCGQRERGGSGGAKKRERELAKMPRPRFTALHPQGSYNETKDIVDRLLMDSMADECFVLQSIRGKVDPETLDEVRRALSNIAARSRHIGKHLIDLSRVQTPEE